jgi:hypothetical protein
VKGAIQEPYKEESERRGDDKIARSMPFCWDSGSGWHLILTASLFLAQRYGEMKQDCEKFLYKMALYFETDASPIPKSVSFNVDPGKINSLPDVR